jgi:hypothetical protein
LWQLSALNNLICTQGPLNHVSTKSCEKHHPSSFLTKPQEPHTHGGSQTTDSLSAPQSGPSMSDCIRNHGPKVVTGIHTLQDFYLLELFPAPSTWVTPNNSALLLSSSWLSPASHWSHSLPM